MEKETATSAPTLGAVKEVTADELALPLAEGMPEPTPGAAKEMPLAATEAATPPRITSELKDRVGNVFSPEKYKANPDGSPKTDKTGCFISINKGRPKGSGFGDGQPTEIRSKIPQAGVAPVSSPPNDVPISRNGPDQFDAAAELYFNMLCPILCGVISPEWQPGYVWDAEKKEARIENAEEEKKSITLPLATYMRVNGKVDLPPGWALILSIGAYSGKRAFMPETTEKIEIGFSRVKKWFGFGKKVITQ